MDREAGMPDAGKEEASEEKTKVTLSGYREKKEKDGQDFNNSIGWASHIILSSSYIFLKYYIS